MKEKPNYYAIIPAEVRYDNKLRDKAKLLYGEIVALSNKDGVCYASNKYFAELYNVSITTISLLIKDLIDKGYIESEFSYKENTKEIEHRYLSIIKGGYLKNLKEGIKENLNDNNININNININNVNNKDNNKLYNIYESEIGSLSPRQYEIIEQFRNDLSDDLIIQAIYITKDNNANSFNYFKAILNEWKNKGYKYISDIQTTVKKGLNKVKTIKNQPKWLEQEINYSEISSDELKNIEKEFEIFN